MNVNKDTKIFISVSKNPGNTGSKLHNYGYSINKINAIYIPIKCENEKELKNILGIRKFSGISVSMPFKSKIIKYLDIKDKIVKLTNSTNTILRIKNSLKGYNTDYHAIEKILGKIKIKQSEKVLILGNGSIAKNIFEYFKSKNIKNIILTSRNFKNYKSWKFRSDYKLVKWEKRNQIKSKIMVNATPIGMPLNNKKILINKNKIKNFEIVFDLPINKKSKLKFICLKNNLKYISGLEMSVYQGIKQFEIYTGKKLSLLKVKKKFNYIF